MNKNAIQKYAIWARNELIEQVKQRAYQYGISEKGCGDENATIISGRVLKADEKQQRQSFVEKIKKSGYQQAVEEVAYTWFNRFVALRYMEVNDFLPTHVRVFSDPSGSLKPEILTNVLHVDLPGLDRSKVSDLLNTNATEELYRYLLLTQCNALNELLPEIYEQGKPINDYAIVFEGLKTRDNERFLRYWFEVCTSKWKPNAKGGTFRRWYGNNEYVVNWGTNGDEVRAFKASSGANFAHFFEPAITYSALTSYKFSGRFIDHSIFGGGGGGITNSKITEYLLAFVNSVVFHYLMNILSQTLNFEVGQIGKQPVILSEEHRPKIESITCSSISLSHNDWDAFEISWDFKRHPLTCGEKTVAAAFAKWEREAADRFDTLKANEEELNRLFIEIYGLQDELTPEVEDKDVTVRRADLGREIRSLISYAVGCMFGRYSLDVDGLAYAGGEWDSGKYSTFIPDKDNIIPISDDEYFDDDMMGRFVEFVKTVYGADTLEENLKFIADALGGKGTPREVIRNYFLNDFYKDHLKIYQKRPVYWQFDSGKKNGFKALIYMHRYSRDLLAKLRTDYVHEQQERYRTQLSHIASALNTASGTERARLL